MVSEESVYGNMLKYMSSMSQVKMIKRPGIGRGLGQ